jgi:nicotinamidase-related amidase
VENEIVLPKTSSGVFNSTNIDYVLRNLETRHLIIAGIVTDQCVDMAGA